MNARQALLPAIILLSLLPALVVACNDDDPVEPGESADLEFTYDGARSGGYASEGMPAIGSNGLPEFEPWAVAHEDSLGGLVIAGFQETDEATGDVFILQLDPLGTGTFEPCDITVGAGCHGRLFVGVEIDDLASVGEHFEITSGSVTIDEIDAERVRGTFDVTMVSQSDPTRSIEIQDGVIDVPFSDDPLVGSGLACLARNLRDGTNEAC